MERFNDVIPSVNQYITGANELMDFLLYLKM